MSLSTLSSRLRPVFSLPKRSKAGIYSLPLMAGNVRLSHSGKNRSQIQSFFENKNVLITGGTGFLGNVLMEKLLRSCPGIKRIYLAIRPHKGKVPAERVAEIFSGPLFATLNHEMPEIAKKVVCVSADMGLQDWGMNLEDQELIRQEINVVFHTAANVMFKADLRTSILDNVRATRELINLAHRMDNLEAFVHLSTAFANAVRNPLGEKFYDAPLTGNAAISLAEGANNELLAKMAPAIMGSWPNPYLFSKFLAEDVVREMGENLPIAVVRPSMVVSTAEASIRGWINNVYTPTMLTAQMYKGFLRTHLIDGDLPAEVVPVDYVTNAIIACAWDLGTRDARTKKTLLDESTPENSQNNVSCPSGVTQKSAIEPTRKRRESPIPVYNYTASKHNRISWESFFQQTVEIQRKFPLKSAVWCPSFTCSKNKANYFVKRIFLQDVPAIVADNYLTLVGKKPRFVKNNRMFVKLLTLASQVFKTPWDFQDDNVMRLLKKMNKTDKEIFYFDLRNLNWEKYLSDYTLGIREYLFQETMDTVPEGREKRRRFLAAQYTIILTVAVSSLSTLYLLI